LIYLSILENYIVNYLSYAYRPKTFYKLLLILTRKMVKKESQLINKSQLAVLLPVDYDMRECKIDYDNFTFIFESLDEHLISKFNEIIQDELSNLNKDFDSDSIKNKIKTFLNLNPPSSIAELKENITKAVIIYTDLAFISSGRDIIGCNVKVVKILDNRDNTVVTNILHSSPLDLRVEELLELKKKKMEYVKRNNVMGTKSIFHIY